MVSSTLENRFLLFIFSCTVACTQSQIIVKEDYKVAAGFVALGLVFISEDLRDTFGVIGVLSTLFGAFLTYQVYHTKTDRAMVTAAKATEH